MTVYSEPDDNEIDAIQDAAYEAAEGAWGPAGCMGGRNPYDEADPRHEVWACAFRNRYARSHGY